jgi:hypothetical protein
MTSATSVEGVDLLLEYLEKRYLYHIEGGIKGKCLVLDNI